MRLSHILDQSKKLGAISFFLHAIITLHPSSIELLGSLSIFSSMSGLMHFEYFSSDCTAASESDRIVTLVDRHLKVLSSDFIADTSAMS